MKMLKNEQENLSLEHKIVRLSGRLDADSVEKRRQEITRKITADRCSVILNLSSVEFIDSTGLGFLVSLHQEIEKQNRKLIICEVSQQARLLFELTRLNHIFDIFDSEERALKSV